MIRLAVVSAYQAPETLPREVMHRCSRVCCFSPYGCVRHRSCDCHKAEVRS